MIYIIYKCIDTENEGKYSNIFGQYGQTLMYLFKIYTYVHVRTTHSHSHTHTGTHTLRLHLEAKASESVSLTMGMTVIKAQKCSLAAVVKYFATIY